MASNSNKTNYPHIIISGSPYLRGKSYGEQCKEKIVTNVSYYKTSASLPPWTEVKQFIQNNYLKAIEKYFASGLQEMRGIADGAGVTLEEIILLNARYDLQKAQRQLKINKKNEPILNLNECTGAVILPKDSSSDVLIGQNWDIDERIMNQDMALILEVRPDLSEHIAPFIMFTEVGQLGRSGINMNGMGIVAMALFSTEDHFDLNDKNGYIPVTLLRRMFIESPTFSIGIKRILSSPRHVSVNMMIATKESEGSDAINIELTPSKYYIDYPLDSGILTHANHFKNQSFLSNSSEGSRSGSSLYKDRRLQKHLQDHGQSPIDEPLMALAFMDHFGFPESLCMHVPDNEKTWTSSQPKHCTVACVIYNLSKKVIKICKGPPCRGQFINYKLTKL